MRRDAPHGLLMRMTLVKDNNGAIMKFRCRLSIDIHINFSVRMPPQGAPRRIPQTEINKQHLQTMQAQNRYTTYTVNHPF